MDNFCKNKCQLESVLHYLAEQLSPVIFGSKPAMLIGFHCWDKLQSCPLFFNYRNEILNLFGVKACVLNTTEVMTQVYFYREKLVQQAINDELATEILKQHNYTSLTVDAALKELTNRFKPRKCPHEIGIFLGYPSKDVAGYISGDAPSQVVKSPWRVYGDIRSSVKLMKRHNVARKAMRLLLEQHQSIHSCMEKLYPVVYKIA